MSNLSVVPKMLRFRTISPKVISNLRKFSNGCNSERTIEFNKYTSENGILVRQKVYESHFTEQSSNCRLMHTHTSLWKSTKDESTKNTELDQFRAEEEKIEREYEQKEKQRNDNQSKSDSTTTQDHDKIHKIRSDILESSLQFVPTHGWSVEAIAKGAEAINYPGVAHGLFPNGAIELIHHFYTKCNHELIEKLQQELSSESNDQSDGKSEKTVEKPSPKDFAIKAIRLRLEMIVPYKETWPQALAIMTLPQNVPTSLAQLLTLVDDICHCAGDRSVDIGWYTRRIGIASIYKMVELYLLQDKSPGHQQTWEFLERRIDEGIQIQEFLSTSDQKTQTMAKALGSAFQTARNILGINCDRR